jgi:hypothetical protein
LASVQARLTQCYYLLTQSRVNHCWRTFGTVSQLSLAIGLNRSNRSAASSIELECRRRTFWCAYTLDVHLSVVLGRPQLFHDEDIDAELPTDIEDHRLVESQHATSGASAGLSTMLAPLAHIKCVESAIHPATSELTVRIQSCAHREEYIAPTVSFEANNSKPSKRFDREDLRQPCRVAVQLDLFPRHRELQRIIIPTNRTASAKCLESHILACGYTHTSTLPAQQFWRKRTITRCVRRQPPG